MLNFNAICQQVSKCLTLENSRSCANFGSRKEQNRITLCLVVNDLYKTILYVNHEKHKEHFIVSEPVNLSDN